LDLSPLRKKGEEGFETEKQGRILSASRRKGRRQASKRKRMGEDSVGRGGYTRSENAARQKK